MKGYVRVPMDAGLDEAVSRQLLQQAGARGWLKLTGLHSAGESRQKSFVDRIEGSGKPTWRPNGASNDQLHRSASRGRRLIRVLLEHEYPYDEAHIAAAFRGGDEIIGFCDDVLGDLLDRVEVSIRAEIASLYLSIRQTRDVSVEFSVLKRRSGQYLSEIEASGPGWKLTFETCEKFALLCKDLRDAA